MYVHHYIFQSNIFNKFSVGVLYLAIESLPRNIHFKRKNILVVGIMPGPNKPSGDINTYLEPLICDNYGETMGRSYCQGSVCKNKN